MVVFAHLRPRSLLCSSFEDIQDDTCRLASHRHHLKNNTCSTIHPYDVMTKDESGRLLDYIKLWASLPKEARCDWLDLCCHLSDSPSAGMLRGAAKALLFQLLDALVALSPPQQLAGC